MHEVITIYDPFLHKEIKWSTWRPRPTEIVPIYVDKYVAYRPMQQRARDGTIVRHRTARIAPHQSDQR
jgi:hypothetical protein